jgi:hypothetical protein
LARGHVGHRVIVRLAEQHISPCAKAPVASVSNPPSHRRAAAINSIQTDKTRYNPAVTLVI